MQTILPVAPNVIFIYYPFAMGSLRFLFCIRLSFIFFHEHNIRVKGPANPQLSTCQGQPTWLCSQKKARARRSLLNPWLCNFSVQMGCNYTQRCWNIPFPAYIFIHGTQVEKLVPQCSYLHEYEHLFF